MAIYDVAGSMQHADAVGGLQQGMQFGNALRELRRQNELRQGLQQFADPMGADYQGAANFLAKQGAFDQAGVLAKLREMTTPEQAKWTGAQLEGVDDQGNPVYYGITSAGPQKIEGISPQKKQKIKVLDDGTVVDEASLTPGTKIPLGFTPSQRFQMWLQQNKPQLVETSEGFEWIQPGQVPTGKPKPKGDGLLPDGVANARSLYGRAVQSLERYERENESIAGKGKVYVPGSMSDMSSIPLVGNYMTSSDFKRIQPIAKNFIAAVLRKESGGAITEDEWDTYYPMYFPDVGDSKEAIASKAAMRKDALEQLRVAAQMPTAQTPNPQSQAGTSAAAPKAGTVVDGYMFLGGDVNDASRWRKVK